MTTETKITVAFCMDVDTERKVCDLVHCAEEPAQYAKNLMLWAVLARECGNTAYDEDCAQRTQSRVVHEYENKLRDVEQKYVQHVDLIVEERTRALQAVHDREMCAIRTSHDRELKTLHATLDKLFEEHAAKTELEKLRREMQAVRASTSVLKGMEAEKDLARTLEEATGRAVTQCGKAAHSGDMHLHTTKGRIVVEVKNKQVITREDSEKYKRDMAHMVSVHDDVIGGMFLSVCANTAGTCMNVATVCGVPSLSVTCSDLRIVGQVSSLFVDMCDRLVDVAPSTTPDSGERCDRDERVRETLVAKFGDLYARIGKDLATAEKDAKKISANLGRIIKHFASMQALVFEMVS